MTEEEKKPPGAESTSSTPSSLTEDVAPAGLFDEDNETTVPGSRCKTWLHRLNWMPRWCRWDPEHPPVFSMAMNILFAFAGAFTVATLYYSHPILNVLANDFGVPYDKVSQIPTLAQTGYAFGLITINPLGDLLRRRAMTLSLILFTATLWIGLCITKDFTIFSVITFLCGITTVTPQIMLPLVGDLAPPHRRAAALSVVTAGNLLGILIARLLSGVVTNFTGWRTIYWIALGLQYFIFGLLWLFMPDYPSTNPAGLNYFKMLWSILLMLRKHPVLVQACLIAVVTSAPFTNYWTTLTFLLADTYHYSSLVIGLFALIGIAGMCTTPFIARFFIDRYVPIFSVLCAECVNMVGIILGTYTGLYSVAGPVLQAFLLDIGLQVSQIANRSSIYSVEPLARNRVNTAYMVATFIGQIIGTSAGASLYARGGWVASGSLSVGMIAAAICAALMRGPWEEGWVGWGGGWNIRKKDRMSADSKAASNAEEVKKDIEEAVVGAPSKRQTKNI